METIVCKDIWKIFQSGADKVEALRGINLSVKENEMLMLVGPSGAGKTTLLTVIAGILTQNEGECTVLGKDINHLPEKEKSLFRGESIGFVFQSFNLIPSLTAEENISIPLVLQGISKEEAILKANQILDQLDLKDKQKRYPSQLSGGEQQRVSIARGCIHRPKIILCDEPTSFLDAENGKKVMSILKDFQEKDNSSVIVVTHDIRIEEFADRIVHIEDGVIKEERKNHKGK